MSEPRRFALLAYACEPGKGSEPQVGWTWALMLARLGETWVFTRANNAASIETGLRGRPEAPNLHFEYVDLPPWSRKWKKGQRGMRLYYILWLFAVRRRLRITHLERKFNLVWHVTIANVWLGSVGQAIGVPFILGPVAGGVGTPWRHLHSFGWRGALYELARSLVRFLGRYLNPLARQAWRNATLILAQNRETHDWLPRKFRDRTRVMHNIVLMEDDLTVTASAKNWQIKKPYAIFAGRLLAWKGVSVAIRAVAPAKEWTLIICGSGPDKDRLRRLVSSLRLNDRVHFLDWVPRAQLKELIHEADALLFPSFHDEGSYVVAEAACMGTPVICLDRGGPPVLAGSLGRVVTVDVSTGVVVKELTDTLNKLARTDSDQNEVTRPLHLLSERAREVENLVKTVVPNQAPPTDAAP